MGKLVGYEFESVLVSPPLTTEQFNGIKDQDLATRTIAADKSTVTINSIAVPVHDYALETMEFSPNRTVDDIDQSNVKNQDKATVRGRIGNEWTFKFSVNDDTGSTYDNFMKNDSGHRLMVVEYTSDVGFQCIVQAFTNNAPVANTGSWELDMTFKNSAGKPSWK